MPDGRILTAEQSKILQHALGVDEHGQGKVYRNHFCAGGSDESVCRQLVEMWLMYVWHENKSPLPYYNCAVTDEGKRVMLAQSPKPPKLTRSQKRYRRFLAMDTGYSFGEWLQEYGGSRG